MLFLPGNSTFSGSEEKKISGASSPCFDRDRAEILRRKREGVWEISLTGLLRRPHCGLLDFNACFGKPYGVKLSEAWHLEERVGVRALTAGSGCEASLLQALERLLFFLREITGRDRRQGLQSEY